MQVPIGYGYSFVMIDRVGVGSVQTPQNGELYQCVSGIGAKGDYAAIVEDIPAYAGDRNDLVLEFGGLKLPAYSMLDMRTGAEEFFKDRASFQAAAQAAGIAAGDIATPEVFYQQRRWSLVDALFPILVLGIVGSCAVALIRRFRESLRDAPVLAKDGV